MSDALHADPGRWLLSGDLPCLTCQYNLRGLVGPIVACPECGHHNDLRNAWLWAKKQLPLGVRQREHWPASAVLFSFAWLFAIPLAAMWFGGSGGVIIPLFFAVLGLFMWFSHCRRWAKASLRLDWAIGVLVLLHLCVWTFLSAPVIAANPFSATGETNAAYLILMPIAVAGIFVVKYMIGRADSQGGFRDDWRTWQIPIGPYQTNEQ